MNQHTSKMNYWCRQEKKYTCEDFSYFQDEQNSLSEHITWQADESGTLLSLLGIQENILHWST